MPRRPLGQRNINTEAPSTKASSFAPSSFLKKDSRAYERKPSYSSVESNNENNNAINSMSTEGLRRAVSNSNLSTCAETGQSAPVAKPTLKKAASSSSDNESVTIIEHRKRPNGDGYTVHKYLRGKLLGKGGFAKVYKATSLDTNKEYAVKIVPKANLVKSRARQKVSSSEVVFVHNGCFVSLLEMRTCSTCSYVHMICTNISPRSILSLTASNRD